MDPAVIVALVAAGSSLVVGALNARRSFTLERAKSLEERILDLERKVVECERSRSQCEQQREALMVENRSLLAENLDLLRKLHRENGGGVPGR